MSIDEVRLLGPFSLKSLPFIKSIAKHYTSMPLHQWILEEPFAGNALNPAIISGETMFGRCPLQSFAQLLIQFGDHVFVANTYSVPRGYHSPHHWLYNPLFRCGRGINKPLSYHHWTVECGGEVGWWTIFLAITAHHPFCWRVLMVWGALLITARLAEGIWAQSAVQKNKELITTFSKKRHDNVMNEKKI